MTNSERVQSLLASVIDVPADQRAQYLHTACGDDVSLRTEVESLLASLDRAAGFLGSPTAEIKPGSQFGKLAMSLNDPTLAQGLSHEREGQLIGRYKLLQMIGEGGFGTVWMAEQREPVKRRVALKIIKLGMDTKQVIARFEAERQALAMMDHPNIAKVLDAGATDAGRPYFVMEYIRGVPILEYCDTERLDTKARLQLFTNTCHAIQHAHQKGIIHRDIKPSNVIVTMHDGVPVPKVIDFGIAKATSSELTNKTLFTEHRQMIGTPAYMSPEQAEMSGLDIDTRSDIYSLGVLLYQLLTGTTPFDSRSLMEAGFAEMMRIIREVEPHKPSTRLSSMGVEGTRMAVQRQATDPKKLVSTLKGDLDWIVMKCLEKDRTRRYETASGLAADIKRHLNDEPVTAGAPSARYRLGKFIKRNRLLVVAGAAVAITLVIGAAGTTVGMISASRERDRAEVERAKATLAAEAEVKARLVSEQNEKIAIAETQRAQLARKEESEARLRAEAISKFVIQALRSSDAQNLAEFRGAGQDLTIFAAMENAVADIDSGRFRNDPATESSLRAIIAQVNKSNGRIVEAEPLALRALELSRRIHLGDHPDLAEKIEAVALIYLDLRRLDEADVLMTEAMAMRRRLHTGDDPALTGVIQYLGSLRFEQGRYQEAAALNAEALERSRRTHTTDHTEVAICLNNLALARQALGDHVEAVALLSESLDIHRRLFPGDHPEVAAGLNNLGLARTHAGRYLEAEELFVQAVGMRERLYKEKHPALAVSLVNLSATRLELGRPVEAESTVTKAEAMLRACFVGDHPSLAAALSCRAKVLLALNRAPEADKLMTEAIGIEERTTKGDSNVLVGFLRSLAEIKRTLGHDGEADAIDKRAEAMAARISERAPPNSHASRSKRAVQYWSRGELGLSIPLFESLLQEQQNTLGKEHIETRSTAANLGVNYKDAGRFIEAIPLLEAAYKSSKTEPRFAFVMPHLLEAYAKLPRPDHLAKAEALIETFLELGRSEYGVDHPEFAGRLSLSAQWLLLLQGWARAEPLAREALKIREQIQPDAWNTFNTKSVLGGAVLGLGRLDEAEVLLIDGYNGMKSRESTIPKQSIDRLQDAIDRLIALHTAKGDTTQTERWKSERAKFDRRTPQN